MRESQRCRSAWSSGSAREETTGASRRSRIAVAYALAARLRAAGHGNVCAHGNSRRLLDSYNWSLMAVLAEHPDPAFDYVFIDGAHTWAHDALAFLLADRLLVRGGYMDFDDYGWTLASSPSLNPAAFPEVAALYTEEQITTHQVALVVDLLVRRDERYEEVVDN